MAIIKYIEDKLGISVNHSELIYTAFQHTSYVNENRKRIKSDHFESNERLEYLGDAVLELIVSEYLYKAYPQQPEGFLSRTRAKLVQEESLGRLALDLGFDQYIQLGKGEKNSGGQYRFSILSDCFEAFLGALYLDQGFKVVQTFLQEKLLNRHLEILEYINQDYKTLLQERLQSKGNVKIDYRLEDKSGPDHQQTFKMALYVDDTYIVSGEGRSKKQAESEAAKKAYLELFNSTN